MKRLSKSEGAMIINMTLMLIGMNVAAGVVTELGLFEITRYDIETPESCTDLGGTWYAEQGLNGYCVLSSVVQNEYDNKTSIQVVRQVCQNADAVVENDTACVSKKYQDEGGINPTWDTTLKTLGDVSAAMTSVVTILSSSIINPFGGITYAVLNCAAPTSGLEAPCTEAEWKLKQSWDKILFYLQIPIYLMYGFFFIQIIMNRSLRGSM